MDRSANIRFLGEEKIGKLMLKFSIPCVLSLLVSALYNIVDQIFIGNSELSTLGNAATGVVFPLIVITHAFAWGFGDGCAAYLNLCQGQEGDRKADRAIGTGIVLTLLSGLLLIALFFPFRTELLLLFGASENSLPLAVEYFNILLFFFPAYMLANMLNSVIRADGSPGWAMTAMLAGAAVNLILDPIFIFGLQKGMAGAALATVIGQVVSLFFCLLYLFRTKTFRLTPRSLLPDFSAFSGALKLGASSFITQITIVLVSFVSNITLARYGALSSYGADIPIAVIGIENKVFTVVVNLVVGIVLGCQPIVGYNMGARKFDRVRKLYRAILLCTLVIGLFSTLLFECFPLAVVSLFGVPTNIPNPADYWIFAEKTFRIFLSLIAFTCVIKMSAIFFQAAGRPAFAVISSLIRDIVCFLPLVLFLPRALGVEGVLWAAPLADFVSMAVTLFLTAVFFRKLNTSPTPSRA